MENGAQPGFAVIYDVPVGAAVKDRLRAETGVGISTAAVSRPSEEQSGTRQSSRSETARSTAAPESTGLLSNLASLDRRTLTVSREFAGTDTVPLSDFRKIGASLV